MNRYLGKRICLLALPIVCAILIVGCGDSNDAPSEPKAQPQTSATGAATDDDPLPSPWPGDDLQTAIGVTCSGFGDISATVVLTKFGEDQAFDEFHTVFIGRALADSLDSGSGEPVALAGPCSSRLQWSGDYRKALFSFQPDAEKSVKHVGLIDLETEEVIDLTAARQENEEFGEEILSESAANFELVGSPGNYTVDEDSVIISSYDDDTYASDEETTYVRVPVDNPKNVEPAKEQDSRDNWFAPLIYNGEWEEGTDLYSLGGSWIAAFSGSVEDQTIEGVMLASTEDDTRTKKIACAGEGAALGWLDDARLIVWDGEKLFPLTVTGSGKAQCGKSLLPTNDYSIADLRVSPDGRFVYLGWVRGAAEKSYRVSSDGGKPEAASMPEIPEGLTMFPRSPISDTK